MGCSLKHTVIKIITLIIIIIIIIIINLIYIAQFNTNGILTALYIVIKHIQMQHVPHMNIHETIMLKRIYMPRHSGVYFPHTAGSTL